MPVIAFAVPVPTSSFHTRSVSHSTSRPNQYYLSPNRNSHSFSFVHPSKLRITTDMAVSDTPVSDTPARLVSPQNNTYICTSLTGSTVSDQISQARQAASAGADLVEIRVDLLHPSELSHWSQILTSSPLPSIVTNRASWEGGGSKLSEHQRLSVLIDAIRMKASHIDVELAAFPTFQTLLNANKISLPFPNTRLILSHHNFQRPLSADELASIQAKMIPYADVVKIAMATTSALDNLLVINTLRQAKIPTVVLAMGDLGQPSRILAPKYGAYLTFASVETGKESAPGQVDTHTLISLYRFRDIQADTPVYGVIGNPVGHSMSPALHNAALAITKLPGVYIPLKVEADYAHFIRHMAQCGFRGFSVTIPGKVAALDGMDEMDPVAQKIGAMNTVVQQSDGTLKGYNTDWVAAISAIEEKVGSGLAGKRVVCLGAGGAGRALAFGALERGAESIIIVNRTLEKAEALAQDLGERASGMSLKSFNECSVQFDVLMNSTSVGMHPNSDSSPVDKKALHTGAVVFDAVYNPLRTQLLQDAEDIGCDTVSGVEMFIRQAAEQFRLWFPEVEVPVGKMRSVVLEKLSQ